MDGERHREFLRRAIRLAETSVEDGGGPFGALVVRGGDVVGRGTNRVTATNDPTAHAEIVAIREACRRLGSFRLEGCLVYSSAEPCPMCLGAIYWSRADALYFAADRSDAEVGGFDDALFYRELSLPPDERRLPTRAMSVEGAGEPFRRWLAKPDRVEY